MKYFISTDIRKNDLLRIILVFTLLFFFFLWLTNILLYLEIGFTYEAIVTYYAGSEENFRAPKSYIGLLQESHFHFFSMAIILVTLNHLLLFTAVPNIYKAIIIIISFLSALGDISGGWLIRYVAYEFAYLKIISFILLQTSLAVLIVLILNFFYSKSKDIPI